MAGNILCYSEVLGQGRAGEIVTRALATQRVPHGYLFRGPDGVGKRLFARGLAAAINCKKQVAGRACGLCSSCCKMRSGNHPDFSVISPEKGTIKIDQVRALCRELSFPPYESKMRVVVVEDIHTMRPEAANSLLKTLEEPPANNLLILTAESSHVVLNTIASRCQVLSFYPLSALEVMQAVDLEGTEPTDRLLLARLAEGSPGRMKALMKSSLLELWRELFALISVEERYQDRYDDCWLDVATKMAAVKDELGEVFALLRLWFRDQLLYHSQVISSKELMESWGEELFIWQKGALYGALADIDCAEKKMHHNCNTTLVCEVLLFAFQSKK